MRSKTATARGDVPSRDLHASQVYCRQPPAVSPEDGKLAVKIVLPAEKPVRGHRIMSWNDLPAYKQELNVSLRFIR